MPGKRKKATAARNKTAGKQGLEKIQNNITLKCSCGETEFYDITPGLRACLKCDRILPIVD